MFYRLGLMAFQELADEIALGKVSTRLLVLSNLSLIFFINL